MSYVNKITWILATIYTYKSNTYKEIKTGCYATYHLKSPFLELQFVDILKIESFFVYFKIEF